MVENFDRAVGVDASERMVRKAKQKYPDKDFRVADKENPLFRDEEFDYSMFCLALPPARSNYSKE